MGKLRAVFLFRQLFSGLHHTQKMESLPPLPFTINNYRFDEVIGRGGQSTIFKVWSFKYNRVFAAKVQIIVTEMMQQERMMSEIEAMKSLDHPNVIQLYDTFTTNNLLFMILEYCENGNLEQYLEEHQNLPIEILLNFCSQILDALKYCHSQQIAHRDIKTSNILLDQYNRLKLSDFGICSQTTDKMDLISRYSCSWIWAAPEVINKQTYQPLKADVWSLGVLFYKIIIGQMPWPEDNMTTAHNAIINGAYFIPAEISPKISQILKRMLTVEPSQRPDISEINFNSILPPLYPADPNRPKKMKKFLPTRTISYRGFENRKSTTSMILSTTSNIHRSFLSLGHKRHRNSLNSSIDPIFMSYDHFPNQ